MTGPVGASPEDARRVVHNKGECVARTHIIMAMPMHEVARTRDSSQSIRGTALATVRTHFAMATSARGNGSGRLTSFFRH